MTKNPFINAIAASAYIALVSTFMFYGPGLAGRKGEGTVLIPITMISLFSLSAAMMGYIFLFQPVQMYLDGKKKEAVNLFVKTLLTFGAITVVLLAALFSGILR